MSALIDLRRRIAATKWPGRELVTDVSQVAATARAERRLAAIMAADIVGYSRLVEQDEAGTLAAIRELRREVIDPLLAEHHGRIVKLMGDGAIVEFGSVVDAVACAVAVQKTVLTARPRRRPRAHRIPDRDQPRRRGGRGGRPARRRGQRRRPAGAALRAGRRADLGHGLRPSQGQARPRPRAEGRAAAQEHQRAGADLSGPDGAGRCRHGGQRDQAGPADVAVGGGGLAGAAVPGRPCCLAEAVAADGRGGVRRAHGLSLAGQAFARGAAVREHERRAGAGLLRRWADRRSDHRPIQDFWAFHHRQGFGLPVQGERDAKVRDVAESLGVRYVVDGSVRRAGNTVRVNVQLDRRDDGRPALGRSLRRQPRRHLRGSRQIRPGDRRCAGVEALEGRGAGNRPGTNQQCRRARGVPTDHHHRPTSPLQRGGAVHR